MASQLGILFARLDCRPRWPERLAELATPALVAHGRRGPFFPVGNGEALAREITGARLLVLEGASTAIPEAADPAWEAMIALQALTVPAAAAASCPSWTGRDNRDLTPSPLATVAAEQGDVVEYLADRGDLVEHGISTQLVRLEGDIRR